MFHTACTGDIRPLPSSPTRRSSDLQQLGAGLLAATTGVRADLAVLVHLCVLLALLGAGPACRLTRFEQGSGDRKSTRLNSSHVAITYAVFCLKKKKITANQKY